MKKEATLQEQCEDLLRWRHISFLHLTTFIRRRCYHCGNFMNIPVGGSNYKGLPDLFIFKKDKCVFVELKIGKNKPTEEQREFKDMIEEIDGIYEYYLVRDFEKFKEVMEIAE